MENIKQILGKLALIVYGSFALLATCGYLIARAFKPKMPPLSEVVPDMLGMATLFYGCMAAIVVLCLLGIEWLKNKSQN